MREIKYLSPTSIKLFDTCVEDFYERYLADNPVPREPQYPVMAIGSSFDAYIKAYLYKELRLGDDPRFDLRTMFEAQVEPQNRDQAWKDGEVVFERYKAVGACADLLIMLGDCTDCDFEFSICDKISWDGGEVVLLGKPDLCFTHRNGARVLLDWKVNGWMSKRRPSPRKGYIGALGEFKRRQHKDVMVMNEGGVKINVAHGLEVVDADWGRQLAIYGWLMGSEVGSRFIVAIDQLICCSGVMHGVAQHRCVVGDTYQKALYKHACSIWKRCTSGWFYPELSLEDSQSRCRLMDMEVEDVRIR